jgi:predicted permease
MLRRSGRQGSSGSNRTRAALIVTEVALATVLLVGAGLLVRSFERLMHADPGFRPDRLLVFDAALAGGRYRHDAENNAFANVVEARLGALAGVKSAAVTSARPLDPDAPYGASTSFTVDNEPKPRPGTEPNARLIPVSPKYFATIGASLVRGRFFEERDNRLDAPPVILIDDELARRYFPGVDPIGKRLTFGLSHSTTGAAGDTVRMRGQVVGILRNVVGDRVGEAAEPTAFFPYATAPLGATFVVRVSGDPSAVEPAIRRVVAEVDPTVSVYGLGTMEDALSASVAQPRFYALLLGTFSAVALLLAGIGIFGVVSYSVGQRTREFGIRFALGATGREVTRSVVTRTFTLVSGGILIGAVLAIAATRAIRTLLYGVQPLDLPAFASAMLVLGAVALIAAWLPARRAARIDPMVAMRPE